MVKKGDDLSLTAETLQQENDSVLSAINSNKVKVVPKLVPLNGSAEKGPDSTKEEGHRQHKASHEVSVQQASADEEESYSGTVQLDAKAERQVKVEREKEKKRNQAEKAKLKKLKEQAAAEARAEEIKRSPWIACRPKVRKARVDMLDKIYHLRKLDNYEGTKQDFYDEGLALLEEKYSDIAKEVIAKQSSHARLPCHTS